MRGPVTMLALLGALYVLATAARRLFLSGVVPIADEQAPQSMWLLSAAFVVRSIENIAALGFGILLIIVLAQWIMMKSGRPGA